MKQSQRSGTQLVQELRKQADDVCILLETNPLASVPCCGCFGKYYLVILIIVLFRLEATPYPCHTEYSA